MSKVKKPASKRIDSLTHPRSPNLHKCFRVNIYSREHEPIVADQFDRLRSQEP